MTDEDACQTMTLEIDGANAARAIKDMNKLIQANPDAVTRILVEVESTEPLNDASLEFSVEEIRQATAKMRSIDFKIGSNAFKVATCISDLGDGWLNSGEIRRCVEANTNVDSDKLSQTLWDLSQRGLLEKRPCESDGRMKEYKISEKGEESLAELNEQ